MGTNERNRVEETGTILAIRRYTDRIIQLASDRGLMLEEVNTGGGCRALRLGYGAGEILITSDADLPDPAYGVTIGDYPTDDVDLPWSAFVELDPGTPAELVVDVLHWTQHADTSVDLTSCMVGRRHLYGQARHSVDACRPDLAAAARKVAPNAKSLRA
jgi:hypothetical protein